MPKFPSVNATRYATRQYHCFDNRSRPIILVCRRRISTTPCKSLPADESTYLCLCFGFLLQIMYTYFPPFRFTLLHPSHSFLTELRTFIPRICCRVMNGLLFAPCRLRFRSASSHCVACGLLSAAYLDALSVLKRVLCCHLPITRGRRVDAAVLLSSIRGRRDLAGANWRSALREGCESSILAGMVECDFDRLDFRASRERGRRC